MSFTRKLFLRLSKTRYGSLTELQYIGCLHLKILLVQAFMPCIILVKVHIIKFFTNRTEPVLLNRYMWGKLFRVDGDRQERRQPQMNYARGSTTISAALM